MTSWLDKNYEIILTKDGSPSLRSLAISTKEMMHHSGGAFAETQMIYGEPVREQFDNQRTRVLAVGLGLGYNELLVATEALKRGLKPSDILLVSYEAEDFLKQSFQEFLESEESSGANDEITKTYEQILNFFVQETGIGPKLQKEFLLEMKKTKTWLMLGPLSLQTLTDIKFNVICYDLFSSKTDSAPWTEEFLNSLWRSNCDANCIVSTYACTAALKRSLKNNNFSLIDRDGFLSKRGSTLAKRAATS